MTETLLWLLGTLFYGVGDYVTTTIATRYEGNEEGMPITRAVLGSEPSPLSFVLFKGVALGGLYLGYVAMSGNRHRWIVPASLVVLGIYATANNSYWILKGRRRERKHRS
jgi:hypothetical protein